MVEDVKKRDELKYIIWLYFKVIIVVMSVLVFVIATEPPPPAEVPTFHQFYGEIRDVNGSIVTESVKVSAYINYESRGSVYSDVDGSYGWDPLLFVENGRDGDNIEFYVDYHYSREYIFEEEGITELILTLNEAGNYEDFVVDGYKSRYNLSDFQYIVLDAMGVTASSFSYWADILVLFFAVTVFMLYIFNKRRG